MYLNVSNILYAYKSKKNSIILHRLLCIDKVYKEKN